MNKKIPQIKDMTAFVQSHNTPQEIYEKIQSGFDIDTQDEKGQTVLHVAALSKDCLFVETLLAFNPNPFIQDENGKTPSMIVAQNANSPAFIPTYSVLSSYERAYLAKEQTEMKHILTHLVTFNEVVKNVLNNAAVRMDKAEAKAVSQAMKHFRIHHR